MSVRRESDADAAEAILGGHISGQQAYWAGEAFKPDAAEPWRTGWLSAAAEARSACQEAKPLVDSGADIKAALNEANAAIRALMPAKPRPRQSELARTASSLIEVALMKIQSTGAGGGAPRVVAARPDVSRPVSPTRGRSRAPARRA